MHIGGCVLAQNHLSGSESDTKSRIRGCLQVIAVINCRTTGSYARPYIGIFSGHNHTQGS